MRAEVFKGSSLIEVWTQTWGFWDVHPLGRVLPGLFIPVILRLYISFLFR